MLRKIVFWLHLSCGLLAGTVVFTMSLTGVLLMYERQINAWVLSSHYVSAADNTQHLQLEQLLSIQQIAQPNQQATVMVITNHPGAPVSFLAGRRQVLNLNPYTGETMQIASPELDQFFNIVTGLHRWFNVQGENRALAREITGVSNVIFLFLLVSGLYLWLPVVWMWVLFKVRLFFKTSYLNSKTRDFHWHLIFGFWAALPLLVVVYTGTVISYPWAANLMYLAFGVEIPASIGAPGNAAVPGQGGNQQGQQQPLKASGNVGEVETAVTTYLSLDSLLAQVQIVTGTHWNRFNITLPTAQQLTVQVEVDLGNGAQAHKRQTLSLARDSGKVLGITGFSDINEAQRLRGIARFLHTGEVLGFWGQTIAGLASFAALFMVWTGFALSWRRLIEPLFRQAS